MEKPKLAPTLNAEQASAIYYTYLRRHIALDIILIALWLLSAGLLYLPYRWLLIVRRLFYLKATLETATHVEVKRERFDSEIVPIIKKTVEKKSIDISLPNGPYEFKLFTYLHEDFYFNESQSSFIPLVFNTELKFEAIHHMGKGAEENLITERKKIFGKSIIQVPVPSVFSSFIDEIFQPFFVFQCFCIILWCLVDYLYYSMAILLIMIVTVLMNVYNTQSNFRQIRKLATFSCSVKVLRTGKKVILNSTELVPGDVLYLNRELVFPCDLILVRGFCLVDETMLTGESQPATKTALPEVNKYYNKEKLYTLSAGTKIVDCTQNAKAVVIGTGYNTAKGSLVRWILHPRPNRFRFVKECFIFLGILTVIAIIEVCADLKALIDGEVDALGLVFIYFTIVSTALPPILPLTFTISIAYSYNRLKKKKISCIDREAINASGRVTVVCFDKTGTLTKDEMKLIAAFEANSGYLTENPNSLPIIFQKCLASCHSLTYYDKKFLGDPQEIAILQSLNWMVFPGEDGSVGLICPSDSSVVSSFFIYHFEPELKRMATVVKQKEQFYLFVKGAPEVVIPLCNNIDCNIYSTLQEYTQSGYRVLACAYKILNSFDKNSKLGDIEKGLTFLGLPLLENMLKDDAYDTLTTLRKKKVHCAISTGDNLFTGLAAGKSVGLVDDVDTYTGDLIEDEIVWLNNKGEREDTLPILDTDCEFAISGNLLEYLITSEHELCETIIKRCKVFGRMTPKHKIMLIESFQKSDIMVAMVGDGANDCGALKQADVGLSLSDAEASIAAPFSATYLGAIIDILREGRCSLTTCFQSFKFIVTYSMLELHVIIFMNYERTLLTINQYIYYDALTVFPLTFTMAASLPYRKLRRRIPPGSVMSAPILISCFGMMILNIIIMIADLMNLRSYDWYDVNQEYDPASYVNYGAPTIQGNMLFTIGGAMLLVLAVIYSTGKPFREPIYKNIPFTVFAIILLAFDITFFFDVSDFSVKFVDIYPDDHMDYRWSGFLIFIGGAILMYLFEIYLVPVLVKLVRKIKKRTNKVS